MIIKTIVLFQLVIVMTGNSLAQTPDSVRNLKEVTVVGKKKLIEQDIDKTIINVRAMIGSEGNNAYEILEKTPGITINQDGAISLNGKTNVLVLIDGRSTYMSGQDLANYLKSLPGGVLDKIELIDNPSSRYDAAGGAVINIRLKKNRQAGLTGNISAEVSIGKKFRSNESLNLNFNSEKIN
jgi:outer membrane cobalamin receptor